ncbi:protein kinase [Cohnella sp. AR92]|uniref:protein kinase domain-containing protein n=1 Tax=Cohnella sp. AR92 TaxID=648716 RepID=UPI000F8C3CA6|nr:protein kinase [Cohnella sp. AR92]RUS46471.1 hypothetical protein ELR57_15490 [Cohnella sp. AR92]
MTSIKKLSAHLERTYPFANLTPYLTSYSHHGFSYLEGNSTKDGRRIFIKVDGTGGDAAWREANALRLLDIPNVPRVIAYEAGGPLSFVALEWLDAVSLEALLKHRPLLQPARKLLLLNQLCAVLQALHGAKIIHRDIRPANIMIEMKNENWKLVLIDFAFSLRLGGDRWPELSFFDLQPELLAVLGGERYKQDRYVWDDAYAACQVALDIDPQCHLNYPDIWNRLIAMIGKINYAAII